MRAITVAALAVGAMALGCKQSAIPSLTVNFVNIVPWPANRLPTAVSGFRVSSFAEALDHPRNLYVLPNGDVLVAEANTEPATGIGAITNDITRRAGASGRSANRITLLRDADGDGVAEVRSTFLDRGLRQPFGMALLGDFLYIASTDAVAKVRYERGQLNTNESPTRVMELPASGYNNHWTRNLAVADDTHLYVSVGSGTNVDEENSDRRDPRRAAVLLLDVTTGQHAIYASGTRNPVGIAVHPVTRVLWAAVNERDGLGDELPADYLAGLQQGGFYGWPYSYWGGNVDPRHRGEGRALVARAIVPDVSLGAHTASLGVAFYQHAAFPDEYRGGAFVTQHGSWNRSRFAGYRVVFVPFRDGRPSGAPQDFLTGFLATNDNGADAYGRPTMPAVASDGSLLVTDDAGNRVWRVSAEGARVASAESATQR